jgi:diguanylate cyclase (GGDEF)-like protein
MFDVDNFKRVNDGCGHLAGDHLLAEVGRRLGEVLRTSDIKCRYGGDEFLVILPDTPAAGARQVAESIRQALGSIALQFAETTIGVKVSVGVASARAEDSQAQAVIARADHELYRAKQAGRDCVRGGEAEPAAGLKLMGAAV